MLDLVLSLLAGWPLSVFLRKECRIQDNPKNDLC